MIAPRLWGLGLVVVLTACSPALAATDLTLELLQQGFSYLAPHPLDQLSPRPQPAPQSLPPPALLTSLLNGEETIRKGFEPDNEALLARALLSLPLRQRLLKVAVASSGSRRLALIKLQAGDIKSGAFRVADLEDDAISSLRVAFALPLELNRIDLWSVVPGKDSEGVVHQPVFSLSADRQSFDKASGAPKPTREILSDLGLIRFAPQFLRYAGGEKLQQLIPELPGTAWSVAPVSDSWRQLRMASEQDPRLSAATLARVVGSLPVTDNSVALTIDDGPHPLITSLFLDILRQHQTKATFFVVGEKVEECPELLRQMAEEGHEIGNHTYSHPRLGQVNEVEALTQIRGCALAVGKVCGQPTRLLRPPGGGIAAHVLKAATAANCTVVLWTHNTNDWTISDPEQIAANALRDIKPGSIILMHQGGIESARALPLILEGLQKKGLRAATVGEMIGRAPVNVLPIPEIMALYQKHQSEKE